MDRARRCSSIVMMMVLAGCGDPVEEAGRQPLGKADVFGSCEGTDCSGPSADGNCYCDDSCVEIGDCCADKVEVCDLAQVILVGVKSGFCLDVDQESLADGGRLIGWHCHGNANQRWQIVPGPDGFFSLIAAHSGKCLDVKGASQLHGAALIQHACHGGDNQLFALEATGAGVALIARHSGHCVELAVSQPAGAIQQGECHGGKTQQWIKTPQ